MSTINSLCQKTGRTETREGPLRDAFGMIVSAGRWCFPGKDEDPLAALDGLPCLVARRRPAEGLQVKRH